MKRSVNFSSPAKFAALALMREATTETWLCEPSEETKRRRDEDVALLESKRLFHLAIALETACNCVSPKRDKNVGDFLYLGYDQGWRSSGLHEFSSPDGRTRKAPSMMWVDAMRAIHEAAMIRNGK